jgi:hypothetical protein
MQVAHARATFVPSDAADESLTTIVARSVLEAALQEDAEPAELWFEVSSEGAEDVNRLSVDLSHSDIEDLLRLSPEDEIALSLDGEEVESLFSDPDVEAHGLKSEIVIAVTSAARSLQNKAQISKGQVAQASGPKLLRSGLLVR